MRYASVCDGIGAVHVAWQPLGWECAWTSEIEPFPAAVVDHHWKLKNVGDMTQILEDTLHDAGDIQLLVGGTPCQSFSVAGLRAGLADPRGNLALRFVQLVGFLRPKWVVWENVPGVLSSGNGRDFGTFLGALAELGYGFAYRILDAQWFGVAQRRRRVFVVASSRDWRRAAAVLFERESLFGNPPTRRSSWEGVARSTSASLTSSGRGVERCGESRGEDDLVVAFHQQAQGCQLPSSCRDTSITDSLTASQNAAVAYDILGTPATNAAKPTDVHVPLRARLPGQSEASTTTVVAFDTTQITSAANYSRPKPGDPCHPLASGAHPPVVCDDTVGTLRSNTRNNSDPRTEAAMHVMHGMAVRRLTPKECERLQGFPDGYTDVTYRNKPASDGPRYKALGNSMAVPVMAWIGKRIAEVEATDGTHP